MSDTQKHTRNTLILEIVDNAADINIRFKGRSTDRDPSAFILPILMESIHNSKEFRKRIIMDFQDLEYMNSSTVKPIIKIMESSENSGISFSIYYKQTLKWQNLGFSALKIFETPDKRIEIIGK